MLSMKMKKKTKREKKGLWSQDIILLKRKRAPKR